MPKLSARLTSVLLLLLIAGYAAFFTIQLFLHYYSFGSRALDLGNMDQTIWNTLHGRPFHQTNMPGITSRLSLHVEPILLPLSLFYLVYSGPETLFVIQSIVVALGALPVFALARLKLNSRALGLVFAAVYLMFPAIQGATLLDFHPVTLAPTFLLAAFYYLETHHVRWFALFAVLSAACKEEMSLIIMMMGLYAFFVNRQRRLGLMTVALSSGWAFLAVFVIPRTFAGTENIHWDRYGHLGNNPLEILINFFREPGLVIGHLQRVDALHYLWLLLAPTALTALFSPATLTLALPSLGINLLSNFPPMQEVNALIYAAPIVPAVLISSIYGLATIKRLVARLGGRREARNEGRSLPGKRFTPLASRFQTVDLLFGGLVLAATIIYHGYYGYLPGGGQFRGWERVTAHHRRAERLFAQIPAEAALSAQDRLNPHVSQRKTLYIFDRVEDADHIVLDVTEDSWPLHPVELRHRVDQFLAEDFGILEAFDGYLLLAKDRPELPVTLPDAFFDFARVTDPDTFQSQFSTPVTFDDTLRLLGYDLDLGAHEEKLPVITLYWQAIRPLEQGYALWPFIIDRQGRLIEDPTERPLVTTLWYPIWRWSPDEIIMTRTLPRDLGDEFILAVGVAKGAWTDPSQRLPITQVDDSLYTFEHNTWARLGAFRRVDASTYQPVDLAPASPETSRQAEFWNVLKLQGVDLPDSPHNPGDPIPFTLYWQSTAPIAVDLTAFAHLLDEQGSTVAQLDWFPQDRLGYLPTTAWQPQRPVADSQVLILPDEIPPGQYRLVVGWYYSVTGDRLPLTASDVPGESGNVAEVGTITVR